MNYLAHIFLSGPDRQIRLGNFIGDAVKGNSYNDYPSAIRKGILLHRAIDDYTDHHPAFIECVRRLKPCFGRYSSILADIYFDYLLASRFQEFSEVPLKRFTRNFYWTMILYRHRLPARIKRFMWHFIGTGRLDKYASVVGIRNSLEIMVRVGRIELPVERAVDYLATHEEELWVDFKPFFGSLQLYCADWIATHQPAKGK